MLYIHMMLSSLELTLTKRPVTSLYVRLESYTVTPDKFSKTMLGHFIIDRIIIIGTDKRDIIENTAIETNVHKLF